MSNLTNGRCDIDVSYLTVGKGVLRTSFLRQDFITQKPIRTPISIWHPLAKAILLLQVHTRMANILQRRERWRWVLISYLAVWRMDIAIPL